MSKKVLAIHDISCFGKCSLTVALPILSAMELETTILPTAILSTHTGGYTNYTFNDLSDDLLPITEHFWSLNLSFDGLYSGYLGSIKQIDILITIFKSFKTDYNIIMTDPVMGDNGKLYTNFDMAYVDEMRKLCILADVLTPNVTEAYLLLNKVYKPYFDSEEDIKAMIKELAMLNQNKIVLTGVCYDNSAIGVATYDFKSEAFSVFFNQRIEGFYHGSGDVFSSVLCGGLIKGLSLYDASKKAADFTVASIQKTKDLNRDNRQGLVFEAFLKEL